MKRGRTHGFVSLAIVTIGLAVLVAALPVVRAFAFAESSGETKVSFTNVCTGGVRWTPADNRNDDPRFYWHLNSNPDNVTIPYNVSWEDARNTFPVPPTAYHNFTLDAVHLSDPVRHDEKRVQTNGGVSETHWVLSVTATNVYSLQWVNVTFTASLHLQGGSGCPIDDSVTMYYKFVYP